MGIKRYDFEYDEIVNNNETGEYVRFADIQALIGKLPINKKSHSNLICLECLDIYKYPYTAIEHKLIDSATALSFCSHECWDKYMERI